MNMQWYSGATEDRRSKVEANNFFSKAKCGEKRDNCSWKESHGHKSLVERDPLDMRTPRSHNFQSKESVPQYVRFTASPKRLLRTFNRIPRWLTVQFSGKIQVTHMYRTCITTVRLGYVPPHPHSGVEPAEGNKTGGPVGSRNTSLIFPVAGSCNTHTHTNTHTCLLCLRTSTLHTTSKCNYSSPSPPTLAYSLTPSPTLTRLVFHLKTVGQCSKDSRHLMEFAHDRCRTRQKNEVDDKQKTGPAKV